MFGLFKSRNKDDDTALHLYAKVVNQARMPVFYQSYGVSDDVDGRFDMIVLHAHLLFDRLKDGGPEHEEIAQSVFDTMFADMDRNLREMGVGDIGVSKRIRAMSEAFYGRATAYALALKEDDEKALTEALHRNLYRKSTPSETELEKMASYVRYQSSHISQQQPSDIKLGNIDFAAPL